MTIDKIKELYQQSKGMKNQLTNLLEKSKIEKNQFEIN